MPGSPQIERVRTAYAGFAKGDLATLLEMLDERIEWDASGALLHTGIYRGRAGVLEYLGKFGDVWEEFQLVAEEFLEMGPDLVIVHGYVRGRPKGGGEVIEAGFSHHVHMLGGRARRMQIMLDAKNVRRGSSAAGRPPPDQSAR
jgi:ketosteroid isomerase-like protein